VDTEINGSGGGYVPPPDPPAPAGGDEGTSAVGSTGGGDTTPISSSSGSSGSTESAGSTPAYNPYQSSFASASEPTTNPYAQTRGTSGATGSTGGTGTGGTRGAGGGGTGSQDTFQATGQGRSGAANPYTNPYSSNPYATNPYANPYASNPSLSGQQGQGTTGGTGQPANTQPASTQPATNPYANNPYLNPYTTDPNTNPYTGQPNPVQRGAGGRVDGVNYPNGGRLGTSYDPQGGLNGITMRDQQGRTTMDVRRDGQGWVGANGQRVPGEYSLGRDGTLSYRNQGWESQTRADGTSQTTHQQSGARFGYDDQNRLTSAQMGNTRADFSYHPDDHQDPRLRGQMSQVRYTGPDGQARTVSPTDVRWDERNNMFNVSGRDADGTRRELQMDLNGRRVGESWDRNGNGGYRIRNADGTQNLRDYTNSALGTDGRRNVTTDRELDRTGRETSRVETTTDRNYDNQRNLNRQVVTTETTRNGGRPNVDITGNIRQPNGQWSEFRTVNGRQLYNTQARPDGRPDTANDGALIGRNGQVYEPNTPLNRAPSIGPNNGRRATETVLFVNGINNSRQDVQESMQALANRGGFNVVGVFNASRGTIMDTAQSIGDKWGISGNPATATLRDQILGELRDGRDVHLFAHSQGGIITSGALGEVKDRLTSQYGERRANEMMNRIRVETFGGAAWRYPDGPQYVHYYHSGDPVSTAFGQGLPWWVSPAAAMARNPGANATTIRIPLTQEGVAHNFTNTYVPHLQPFNEVYRRR